MGDTSRNPSDHNGQLTELIGLVRNLADRLGSLEDRFTSLEQKVETRLQDTRPLWEAVQAQISALQAQVGALQAGQDRIEREMRQTRKALGKLYVDVQNELADYDDRIESLENARQ